MCIGAARQSAFERRGIDAGRDGLLPDRARIYASAEAHHSLFRAAGILGLGRRSVRTIDVDDAMRIDMGALEALLDADARDGVVSVAIVANAGTVNSGAVDLIAGLVRVAKSRGIWLHVDGAYGGFGCLDPAAFVSVMCATIGWAVIAALAVAISATP